MKRPTRSFLITLAVCLPFLIPSFSFGQLGKPLVECYELIGHEKALEIARSQYSAIRKAHDELEALGYEITRIWKKMGSPSWFPPHLFRDIVPTDDLIPLIFNAYVEDKITLDETETILNAVPILYMLERGIILMANYKATLDFLEECIEKHETALERERREARDVLDRGGFGGDWVLKSGYPLINPQDKELNYTNRHKTFSRDISASTGTVTIHDQNFHGSTGAVTSDYVFTFNVVGYIPETIRPGDEITVSINASAGGSKMEGLR